VLFVAALWAYTSHSKQDGNMADLYSPKRATDILGISPSALRIYTDRYKSKLSTEATSTPRKFTEMDLRTLAFVVASTKEGKTHEQVLAAWEEFDNFEWEPPEVPIDAAGDASTALVPVAQLQAAQALMLDAQRREQEAIVRAEAQARELREQAQQRERELLDQVHRLQREMGKAEGKIESLEAQLRLPALPERSKSWWVRLFGG
jgi:DNA-binding transcriptional MerR regulator